MLILVSPKSSPMKNLVLFTLMALCCACLSAQDSKDCGSKNCIHESKLGCFVSSDPCNNCDKHLTGLNYYTDFTGTGDVFNTPGSSGCPEWSMLTCGNNCCDNPNFNCKQKCNTINQTNYPYQRYPRMMVVNGGRLGGDDRCLQLNCYPGDHIQTQPKNSRSEITIRPTIVPGKTVWISWSFKLPVHLGYDQDKAACPSFKPTHFIIGQFHHYPRDKKQKISSSCSDNHAPPFILNLTKNKQGNGYFVGARYGVDCEQGKNKMRGETENSKSVFPVELDTWYDVVLGITWSTDNSVGKIDVSIYKGETGDIVFESLNNYQANLYPDNAGGWMPNNLQLGVYRGDNFCTKSSIFIDEFSMAEGRTQLKAKWASVMRKK